MNLILLSHAELHASEMVHRTDDSTDFFFLNRNGKKVYYYKLGAIGTPLHNSWSMYWTSARIFLNELEANITFTHFLHKEFVNEVNAKVFSKCRASMRYRKKCVEIHEKNKIDYLMMINFFFPSMDVVNIIYDYMYGTFVWDVYELERECYVLFKYILYCIRSKNQMKRFVRQYEKIVKLMQLKFVTEFQKNFLTRLVAYQAIQYIREFNKDYCLALEYSPFGKYL